MYVGLYPGPRFLSVVVLYVVLTTLYSCWLKKLVLVDVVVLALLYTMRLLAGGAAVSIMPSFWLLSFAMFIFFSLALMKRSADLVPGRSNGQNQMEGRGYLADDAAIVQMSGISSGYMSVLVLALYINSEDVRLLYAHPELIWLLCPLLFYWISRVWLITSRGKMTEDPVLFAIRDRVSQAVAVLTAIILWWAT
jgi:4-hydroxybenzoate polyprenyltransferase